MATIPQHTAAPNLPALESAGPAQRRRTANRLLETAWSKGWLDRPTLDPDELIAAARKASKTGNLHDGCWRDRLNILASALEREASLNNLGRVIAHGQITAALLNRARMQALWARHPEIGEIKLQPPILIVGQMRSGSTRIQRLLACDPRLTFTRFYESWNPLPRFWGLAHADRVIRAAVALSCAHFFNPAFRHIHPTGVHHAEEEMGLQNISMFGSAFEAQWRVPSFTAAVEDADPAAAYAEFKRLLQTIAWFRRRAPSRPWLLKLPQFAQDMDAVLATFAGARVIRLHRNPEPLIASSASLVHNQMSLQSDDADARWIGQEWLRKTALRERRLNAALRRSAVPSVDVHYDAVNQDWRGQIARIYKFLDMPLRPSIEQGMSRFIKGKRHKELRRHNYDLGQFGLSRMDIHQAMTEGG